VTDLLALCGDLPVQVLAAGEVLVAEGAPPSALWILQSGTLVVERDGVPFARIDTPGAVFGEMSVVLDRPVTATVRASSDVQVRVVEDPQSFLISRPEATLTVLRTTAARLDGLTQYLVDVKRQFSGHEGHLGMLDEILDTLVHHQGPPARPGSVRDPDDTAAHDYH